MLTQKGIKTSSAALVTTLTSSCRKLSARHRDIVCILCVGSATLRGGASPLDEAAVAPSVSEDASVSETKDVILKSCCGEFILKTL